MRAAEDITGKVAGKIEESRVLQKGAQEISVLKVLAKDSLFIGACLIIGFLLRFHYLLQNPVLDSDEAIVGLMAKHILEGKSYPIFYYGQPYMGSLEAFLAASLFNVFKMSAVVLKLVPLSFSLILIPLGYVLGYLLGNIPVARLTALLFTVPSASHVMWSVKARGGFMEVIALGALALCIAGYMFIKERMDNILLLFGLGTVLGVGWWTNFQIVYFFVPVAFLFIVWLRDRFDIKGFKGMLWILFWSGSGFMFGSIPFWIYNLQNDFASFDLILQATANNDGFIQHFSRLWTEALPILMGSKRFWQEREVFSGAAVIGYLIYGCAFALCLWDCIGRDNKRTDGDGKRRIFLFSFILFIIGSLVVFSWSSYGHLTKAPRYLLPLIIGMSVIVAYLIARIYRVNCILGNILLVCVIAFNLASRYYGKDAVGGQPFVFGGERVSRDHSGLIKWLSDNGISYVFTNYWIGYRLAFETEERVKFGMFQEPRTVRIAEYEALKRGVPERDRVYVLVNKQARIVERALKGLGKVYSKVKVSGYDVIYNIHFPQEYIRYKKKLDGNSLWVRSKTNRYYVDLAVDGDINTRWGTGKPQAKGDRFIVNLKKGVEVYGIRYRVGKWLTDMPRSLRIIGVDLERNMFTLLKPKTYDAILYYIDGSGEWELALKKPLRLQRIILIQEGQDKLFDWSIAEIEVYGIDK